MTVLEKNIFFARLSLISLSAFSQIEHKGFLGAAFSGVSLDSSGSIVNQVGPIADFAQPVGLAATATKSTLLSGESSQLRAALQLDDGTITHLPFTVVEWSSASDQVSIEEAPAGILATAKVISKRSRVALQATSQGLSAHFFIRVKPGETVSSALENSRLPSALADSVRLSQPGWKESGWFGTFYQPNGRYFAPASRVAHWPKRTPIPFGFQSRSNGLDRPWHLSPSLQAQGCFVDLSHVGTTGQDLLQFLEKVLRACDSRAVRSFCAFDSLSLASFPGKTKFRVRSDGSCHGHACIKFGNDPFSQTTFARFSFAC